MLCVQVFAFIDLHPYFISLKMEIIYGIENTANTFLPYLRRSQVAAGIEGAGKALHDIYVDLVLAVGIRAGGIQDALEHAWKDNGKVMLK